jgi:hypothetical protein
LIAEFIKKVRFVNQCIDDGGAVLAVADIAVETEGLARREPALDREVVLGHRTPKDQNVHAGIEPAGALENICLIKPMRRET